MALSQKAIQAHVAELKEKITEASIAFGNSGIASAGSEILVTDLDSVARGLNTALTALERIEIQTQKKRPPK